MTIESDSLMRRTWLVVAAMVALALITLGFAAQRNAETRRLSGCVRDMVVTINGRAAFTARLDTLDAEDRAATRAFWTGVAEAGRDRPKALAVFTRYRATSDDIERRRNAVLKARDAHEFPTLAECES